MLMVCRLLFVFVLFFFFFKQKTAYEMRISDWSSDVCSSDLSSTLSGGPLGWLRAWKTIREGRAAASRLYESFHPSVVVGFGGYPVLPAMLAARKMGIATVIHEQNSVLGRVNRLLARKVDMIDRKSVV